MNINTLSENASDLIRACSQIPTVATMISELVMNSLDAMADYIEVII